MEGLTLNLKEYGWCQQILGFIILSLIASLQLSSVSLGARERFLSSRLSRRPYSRDLDRRASTVETHPQSFFWRNPCRSVLVGQFYCVDHQGIHTSEPAIRQVLAMQRG